MNPQATFDAITSLTDRLSAIGAPFEAGLIVAAFVLAAAAIARPLAPWRRPLLGLMCLLLVGGEVVLAWFHWRLYALAEVFDPLTQTATGNIAVPLWVESEKLYVWALIVAVMGLLMRRQRDELLPGVLFSVALLTVGAVIWGRPFTEPVPNFLGQFSAYLQAMAFGGQAAQQAAEGMESARQFYYNAWYMWVHPPMLFLAYGTFVISFIATVRMIATKHSSYETTAYRWARLGYLPLTLGMLLGFPWAILAWSGESWWWSGKVNMSIMMWLLYTAVLHARLYLRRQGMWRLVALLAVGSFLILVLTYLATYVVPGAHSYAG